MRPLLLMRSILARSPQPGLDVFEEEPKIHHGLIENTNAVLLPHIGTATWETQKDMELLVLDNLKSAIEGKGLLTQVPEQKPKK